jgi:hypothetical protein
MALDGISQLDRMLVFHKKPTTKLFASGRVCFVTGKGVDPREAADLDPCPKRVPYVTRLGV